MTDDETARASPSRQIDLTDRADLLARMADDFMENGGHLPARLPPGCYGFTASLWPEPPAAPHEVHFSAAWPSATLVCLRPLAGYSLEGGLHRVRTEAEAKFAADLASAVSAERERERPDALREAVRAAHAAGWVTRAGLEDRLRRIASMERQDEGG